MGLVTFAPTPLVGLPIETCLGNTLDLWPTVPFSCSLLLPKLWLIMCEPLSSPLFLLTMQAGCRPLLSGPVSNRLLSVIARALLVAFSLCYLSNTPKANVFPG
jgi:hypothetical protein